MNTKKKESHKIFFGLVFGIQYTLRAVWFILLRANQFMNKMLCE